MFEFVRNPAVERKLKWSETKTYEFVTELGKTECLWDTTNLNYKNKKARDVAVDNLAEMFDCPADEIRRKIKGLRGTYIQELHKIEDSKRNNVTPYKPRLIWFDQMDSFLNEQVKRSRLLRTNHAPQFSQQTIKMEEAEDPVAVFPSHDSTVNSTQHQNTDPLGDNSAGALPDEQFIDWNSVDSSELLHSSHSRREESAFDIFGRSVAQQLKEFKSTAAALRAQAKIQSLLSEERIQELTNTHNDNC